MSGFYSDVMYGSGSAQTSVAWKEIPKRGEPINIGDNAAIDLYLNGIPLDSSIVLSIADLHGYYKNYLIILDLVRYIKNNGFREVYVLFNGDLAPRNVMCMGEDKPASLEYACKNFLSPLGDLCKIIFNLGNHELQNCESLYNLLSFLKSKNIPFLTHIPEGIDFNKLVTKCNIFRQRRREPIIPTTIAAELQTNIFPYKIIGNILFFPYCSSFLIYGGGDYVRFLKNDYVDELVTLHADRNRRDNLPPSAEGNLITRITKENFQRAIADLAKVPGPINIVIAAHEFYDPHNDYSDRVRGILELVLRDIVISEEVLNRLTWTIVCGHEHEQYHYQNQSLTTKGGTVQCDVIGTTVHAASVPNFAIMAFKPVQPLPSAKPVTYEGLMARMYEQLDDIMNYTHTFDVLNFIYNAIQDKR